MKNDNSPAAVYERFKLEWMLAHGYTLQHLVAELEKLRATSLPTGSLAMGSAPRSGPALKNFWIANTRKGWLAAMMNSEPKRLCGRYLAENKDDFLKAYHIVVDVKETDKSYIMQLVEFNSRYSASHISLLFSKSKRVVLSKKKGGFAIRSWSDDSFTFYPFQAGTPYYFEKLPGTGGKEEHAVQEVKPIQDDCLECESKDCAYNRDGICRFSKVFDRGPSITEEDGCTEFVIRHTY